MWFNDDNNNKLNYFLYFIFITIETIKFFFLETTNKTVLCG